MPTASTVDHAAGPLQAFGVSFVFFPLLLNGSFGFAQDDGKDMLDAGGLVISDQGAMSG